MRGIFHISLILVGLLQSVACDRESGLLGTKCQILPEVSGFRYSEVSWLSFEERSTNSEAIVPIRFLGVVVDALQTTPTRVRVFQAGTFAILELDYGISEFALSGYYYGDKRDDLVQGFVRHLDDDKSRQLTDFAEEEFGDQLQWYAKHGQGRYLCTSESEVRDAQKFLIESMLHPVGTPPGIGDAYVTREGIAYVDDDLRHLVGYSPNGWLVISRMPIDEMGTTSLSDGFDAAGLVKRFEKFVLEPEKGVSAIENSLADQQVEFEYYYDGVKQ